jgi:hypothetical protein
LSTASPPLSIANRRLSLINLSSEFPQNVILPVLIRRVSKRPKGVKNLTFCEDFWLQENEILRRSPAPPQVRVAPQNPCHVRLRAVQGQYDKLH